MQVAIQPLKNTRCLIVVDPQNDFCMPDREDGFYRNKPAAPIAGANDVCNRIDKVILTNNFDNVYVCMEQRQVAHISHVGYWAIKGNLPPLPAPITLDDVMAGRFVPARKADLPHVKNYLAALQATGRTHMVTKAFCRSGTWGAAMHPLIGDSTGIWSATTRHAYSLINTNTDNGTEMYSAFEAAVPSEVTKFNTDAVNHIMQNEAIFICGVRRVEESTRSLLKHRGGKNMFIIRNCTIEVFEKEAMKHGVRIVEADEGNLKPANIKTTMVADGRMR